MNDRMLRACRGEPVDCTPVWIMRQAGRYLPEYQAVRERHSFWQLCTVPELTTEVTLQPIRRFGLDGAILFSDILLPLAAMGIEIDFRPAPLIANPVRDRSGIAALRPVEGHPLIGKVADAVRMIREELRGEATLIGFAGAPFTLATYAVCGGESKNHVEIRRLLHAEPDDLHALLRALADAVVVSLRTQIEAGAQVVQLFDSWAGLLAREEYEAFALRYAREVLERVAPAGVPRIYFAPGASPHLKRMASLECEVLGIDWRIPIEEARERIGDRKAVQGNLDPAVLLGSEGTIRRRTREVLAGARGSRGHVMNLGHGVLPETPIPGVELFIETVRRHGRREGGVSDG